MGLRNKDGADLKMRVIPILNQECTIAVLEGHFYGCSCFDKLSMHGMLEMEKE